jgi:hypothetical protein
MFGDGFTIRDEIEAYFSDLEKEVGRRRAISMTATRFGITPDDVERVIDADD